MTEKTLRDEIAIAALQGMLVTAKAESESAIPKLQQVLAELSYKMADAMLAQRGKG